MINPLADVGRAVYERSTSFFEMREKSDRRPAGEYNLAQFEFERLYLVFDHGGQRFEGFGT